MAITNRNELEKIARDLYTDATAHGVWTDWYIDSNNMIAFDITWGDWKHDHMRLDWIVTEWCWDNGYEVEYSDTVVTDEDGSDTYSGTHYYRIGKADSHRF